jgi:hypothetical protein
MAKGAVIAGVLAGGTLAGGLAGYVARGLMPGGKVPSELEVAIKKITISRDPPNRYWLDRKLLLVYKHGNPALGSLTAALYAFCYNDDTIHHNNPEVLVSVTIWPGRCEFECALFGGPPVYKVYLDGVAKITLSATAAYQTFNA